MPAFPWRGSKKAGILPSTSLHESLRVPNENLNAANASTRINLSALHLITWRSVENHHVEALKTGVTLFLARPEEGKQDTSTELKKLSTIPCDDSKHSSDTDLSDFGHVYTESKEKVRKVMSLIISRYSCSCMCLSYQVADLKELLALGA